MTETQATEAERLWMSYREREDALATLRAVGVDEGELEAARESGVGSDADAVVAILGRIAESVPDLHRRKMAFHFLAIAAERRKQPSNEYRARAIKCELLQYRESGVLLVRVSKPRPWIPAAQMLKLHEQGYDTPSIATMTGYSVPTVDRNLRTHGEDIRIGPQCGRYADRIFSMEEALLEMPLPCGNQCICSWRAVLPSDPR